MEVISEPMKREHLLRALAYMVLTNFLWGSYFPIVKALGLLVHLPRLDMASSPLPAVTGALGFLSLRFIFATALLALSFPRLFRNLSRSALRAGFLVALVFSSGMLCQVVGLSLVRATHSALITSMTVIVVPLIVGLFLGKSLSRRIIVACGVSFLGAAILVGTLSFVQGRIIVDTMSLGAGEVITFSGTVFFAIAICQIDYYNKLGIREELNPGMFIGVVLFTTLSALILGWFIAPNEVQMSPPFQGLLSYSLVFQSSGSILMFLFIVVFGTTFPFYWMNSYQGYFSPGHAALIYTLEPLSAAFWTLWLPDVLSSVLGIHYPSEILTLSLVLGGSLILLSNLIPALEE